VLVLVASSACGGSSDETASPTAPPTTVTTDTAPAAGREQAPTTVGESLQGEALALGDFRGRPVLVNVWSSW
jgi:hypothetical protein